MGEVKDYKPYYKSTVHVDSGNLPEVERNLGEDDWVWYWREPWQRFSLLVLLGGNQNRNQSHRILIRWAIAHTDRNAHTSGAVPRGIGCLPPAGGLRTRHLSTGAPGSHGSSNQHPSPAHPASTPHPSRTGYLTVPLVKSSLLCIITWIECPRPRGDWI